MSYFWCIIRNSHVVIRNSIQMHHIYTSKSIILHREPQDTSAYYWVLTKDFGLLKARAQGVRGAKSRLKGALQEFSLATVAYVHGKAGWKITTAIPERNFFIEAHNNSIRKILAHITDVLVRFITGEEKNEKIFSVVEVGFTQLIEGGTDQSILESMILSRVLYLLGYIDTVGLEFLFTDVSDFGLESVRFAEKNKNTIIKAINKGFKESQL